MVFRPLQKTQDKGATRSLPRTICRNSSTCCIPARPDSPSSWTDCEKVRMFLTTLLMSLVGHTFCHFDGNIGKSSGKWHASSQPTDVGSSCSFFKSQTCVSGCCQPLQHLRDSLVSVWANAGSPPGFLNTPSQYPPTQATAPPQPSKQVLWITVMSSGSANSLLCTADWQAALLFLVQAHHAHLGPVFSRSHGRCFPDNLSLELHSEKM